MATSAGIQPSTLAKLFRGLWSSGAEENNFQRPLRAALIVSLAAALLIVVPARKADRICSIDLKPGVPSRKVDLVFLIDSSRSMANRAFIGEELENGGRGETYNLEIEGVLRSLNDEAVIPRDGSVSVAVVTFADKAMIHAPLSRIESIKDALTISKIVEGLRCSSIETAAEPCPTGGTNYSDAIRTAHALLTQTGRPDARRVILMSTDGAPNDSDLGAGAAAQFYESAIASGIEADINVILMGLSECLNESEFRASKARVDKIASPRSVMKPPGKMLVIQAGECNIAGQPLFTPGQNPPVCDCDRQVEEFAADVKLIAHRGEPELFLTVTTEDDTEPDTPPQPGKKLSLRQAIESANFNGGLATITFDGDVRLIRPKRPLPALTEPYITIDGCLEADCESSVIIDGAQADATQTEQHDHGILIRSWQDSIRNLKIMNFDGAGIAIAPTCPSDTTHHNTVERNTLEDNKRAGVLVLDPQPARRCAAGRNIGNKISRNAISGSQTLIDLSGDGPTKNDDGDFDSGPNTLVNFPYEFTVAVSGDAVKIRGKLNGPTAPGAVVEIFAATEISPVENKAAADAVKFFASVTTDETGAFDITVVDKSVPSISGYTATITDCGGNTSELIPICEGPPRAELDGASLKFDAVTPSGKRSSNPQSRQFTIKNCGCSSLAVKFASLLRIDETGRMKRKDDADCEGGSRFFSINGINIPCAASSKNDAPEAAPQMIDPAKSQTFSVEFHPAIPPIVTVNQERKKKGLSAGDALPDDLKSSLNLEQNGLSHIAPMVLFGKVDTIVKMIDPEDQKNPKRVVLTRSGDELIAEFAIFDSNLDVARAVYQFFDNKGRKIELDNDTADLKLAMRQRPLKLIKGQSFKVVQKFSNASQHPRVSIRVIVFDEAGNSDTADSNLTASSLVAPAAQSFRYERGAALFLPTIKLLKKERQR